MCEKYHSSSTPKETTLKAKPLLGSMRISLHKSSVSQFIFAPPYPHIFHTIRALQKKYLSIYRPSRNVRKGLASDFLTKHLYSKIG